MITKQKAPSGRQSEKGRKLLSTNKYRQDARPSQSPAHISVYVHPAMIVMTRNWDNDTRDAFLKALEGEGL
jgi:hypothetical protein